MGQFAKLDTSYEMTSDVLLDQDFDQFSIQEEWSNADSEILEFSIIPHVNKGIAYEF